MISLIAGTDYFFDHRTQFLYTSPSLSPVSQTIPWPPNLIKLSYRTQNTIEHYWVSEIIQREGAELYTIWMKLEGVVSENTDIKRVPLSAVADLVH